MRSTEQCPKCKNYFIVREEGPNFPGGKEREPIACPHTPCDFVREQMTSGWFRTEKSDKDGNLI